MNPNAVRCMWNGFPIDRSKPRIPLRYRQIRWPGSFAAWSLRRTEGSWDTWSPASQRPFERLATRTLSTWRRSWSRGSPELRRTSRLGFVSVKRGRPRNRRRVRSTPTDGHCRTYPRCFSARWSSSPAKSTASAISRIDFRKSILCR